MADKQATLFLKIKESGAKILDRIVVTFGDIINTVKSAAAAFVDFSNRGAELDTVRKSFENLAASQGQDADKMLAKMRELSLGTVSDLELMKKANQGLLLGLPVDRFGDMLTIARASAAATGESMEFMLNSIVTGLGRGSKLMLDNLGIVFNLEQAQEEYAKSLGKTAEELTEAEKKQAFINKALEIGLANAKASGAGALTLRERYQQLGATFDNFANNLSSRLGPSFLVLVDSFENLLSAMTGGKGIIDSIVDTFNTLSLIAFNVSEAFKVVGSQLGVSVAAGLEAFKAALSGNFDQAKEIWKSGQAEIERISEESFQRIAAKEKELHEAKLQTIADLNRKQAEQDALAAQLKEEKEKEKSEKEFERLEQEAIAKQELKLAQFEAEMAQEDANEALRLQRLIAAKDKEIEIEQNHQKRMALIKERGALVESLIEARANQNRVKDREATGRLIATLATSNNKALALIGKAAALTQIAIDTPVAVGKALAAFPPPVNYIAAGAVGAAMAAQAARVAGIQLAEGGVVMPRPGGIQATIGEGGQPEAVIPLDRFGEFGLSGPNVNITFTGPLLGDEQQAREFALAVDRELLKLRQGNESVAFDEGVV